MKKSLPKCLSVSVSLLIVCSLVSFSGLSSAEDGETPLSGASGFSSGIGSADVSAFTGSATYSIPVSLAPGRLGLVPGISIDYNSHGGSGWIGTGWDIDLGSIQINIKNGVVYPPNDFVFSKSGASSELVKFADASSLCGNEKEYRAKIDDGSFLRFCYNSNPSSSSWRSYDKNGKVFYFGRTANARMDKPNDSTKVFQWKLDRVEDANGNYFTVSYTKSPEALYLKQVDYTGNTKTSLPPRNKVVFNTEPRDDYYPAYIPNFKMIAYFRLKSIETYASDQFVGRFDLTYDTSAITGRSILKKIVKIGSDGSSSLPETIFTYNGNTQESDAFLFYESALLPIQMSIGKYWTPIDLTMGNIVTGDFNGDGRTDFLKLGAYQVQGTFYLSNGSGFTAHDTPDFDASWMGGTGEVAAIEVGDFNGDGKTDFAISPGGDNKLCLSRVDEAIGAIVCQFVPLPPIPDPVYLNFTRKLGDFNGDGKLDVLYIDLDFLTSKLYLAQGDGYNISFSAEIAGPSFPSLSFPSDRIRIADFNGDGRADIHYIQGWGTSEASKIYLSSVDQNGNISFGNPINGPTFSVSSSYFFACTTYHYWESYDLGRIRYGDFNGDKKTDIILINFNGEPSYIYLGTGDTLNPFDGPLVGPHFGTIVGGNYNSFMIELSRIKLGDFNGDGMTDLLQVRGYNTTEPLRIFLSRGGYKSFTQIESYKPDGSDQSFFVSTATYNNGCSYYANIDINRFFFGDFRGNGKTGFFYLKQTSEVNNIIYNSVELFTPGPDVTDVVKKIEVPSHLEIKLDYTPSTDFQNDQLPFPLPVLVGKTVDPKTPKETPDPDTGPNVVSTTTYDYAFGYFDIQDKEFRGFKYVKQTNPDQSTLETWYHQKDDPANGDDEDYKGMQYDMEFREPWPSPSTRGNLISKTSMVWGRSVAKGIYPVFVRPDKKDIWHYKAGDVVAWNHEEYTYDNSNGTMLTVLTSGTDAESITTVNDYNNYGLWLWKVWRTTVSGSESGQVRQTIFDYYPDTGNLKSKEFVLDVPGFSANPKVLWTYYDEGNIKTQTDPKGENATTYTYDPLTKTFPELIEFPATDGIAHSTRATYDKRFGSVEYSWDENNNKTYNTPDPFGRVKETVSYIGESPEIAAKSKKEYFDSVVPAYTKSLVLEKIDSGSEQYIESYAYVDGLGRAIQTSSYGENGKPIISRAYYDTMGRAWRAEGPFEGSSIAFPQNPPSSGGFPWSETTFDYLGRPVTSTSPDIEHGIITSTISYSGLSTTVTDPDLKSKTERKDYLGRIIEVKEHGDNNTVYTTRYAYNAAGDLLTVTDHKNNISEIRYDSLGRKIYMDDPDMGVWKYCYDKDGNLLKQMDAKGQIISFEYDALNRVRTKSYTKVDNPSVVSDPCTANGYTISSEFPVAYSYDNLAIPNGKGRLYRVSNTNVISTINSYDSLGRALSTSKTIAGDMNVYTTLVDYMLSGAVRTMTYPDNFVVTYNYYPGTGLLKSVVGSDGVTYASASLYEPSGKIGQMDFGNGTKTRYTHDPWSQRLIGMVAQTPYPTSLPKDDIFHMGYSMTQAGNIKTMVDYKIGNTMGLSGNIFEFKYTYDDLHRLKTETSTKVTPNNIVRPEDIVYTPHPVKPHAFEKANVNGTDYSFTYDENGNTMSGWDFTDKTTPGQREIIYNADNMPSQITYTKGLQSKVTYFTYDAGGRRAKKTGYAGTTYYIGKHFEVVNGEQVKYIFVGSLRIAKVTGTGVNTIRVYIHKDHLGSTIAVTNDMGSVVWSASYLPYGGLRDQTGVSLTNYLYTDQEYDPETNLYYYGARYYDPVLGKFISPDSVIPNVFDPQALNRYAYARNNPMMFVDPSGHFLNIVIGAVVGALIAGIQSDWDIDAMWKGAVIGAISGAVGYGVYGAVYSSTQNAFIAGVVGGIYGGMVGGMLSTAFYGGDMGKNVLYGVIGGAVMGGIAGGVAGYQGNSYVKFTIVVAAAGVTSGTMAELSGGQFSEGAIPGMMAAAMMYAIAEANSEKGVGGGDCSDCMSPDADPPGWTPSERDKVNVEQLLGGEVTRTSPYGWRYRNFSWEYHGGADYALAGGSSWGDFMYQPTVGEITTRFWAGFYFKPSGWPEGAYLSFVHTQAGSPGQTTYWGRLAHVACGLGCQAHVHIEFHYRGKIYNPGYVLR